MCGITGFLAEHGAGSDEALCRTARTMADAIAHRGPDDGGAWADAAAGIALAHRRLSILDLSAAGHQPMVSADGRLVISFNGEIYNFQELRDDLAALGHSFRGHSDTEVLLAAIGQWGVEETLRQANGMLAFAVWDRQARTLTLARDRLGKKPLYYGWFGSTLLFGSELKALMAHPRFVWSIDRDALALFLRYGWLPQPYCIFEGVRKLPPASVLTIRADGGGRQAEPVIYWSARIAAEAGRRHPYAGTLDDAVDRLDVLLRDAVGLRMIADVSLGALLSGGIDSTTVVALMQAQSTRPVKTFCIGFREPKYNEADEAAAIARHLSTEHTELYVTADDGLNLIPRLPELYDEPFADASQLPTFLVSQLARQQVTVALTGDGGDELFAGYSVYPRCLKQWQAWRGVPSGVRSRLAGWIGHAATRPWLADPGSAGRLLRRARRQRYAAKLAKQAALLRGTTPVGMLAEKRAQWHHIQDLVPGACDLPFVLTDSARWADVDDPLQAMMHVDIEGYMTDDILVKVDRASMAVALEVRCPLLDWRVVAFALGLPNAFRRGAGGGKLVLRRLLARYVPPALTERPKAGFGVPITAWLRGPLRDWAEWLLNESAIGAAGLLCPRIVGRLWRQHLSGSHDHERLLWSLLMFQAWRAHWAGRAGTPAALRVAG